MILCLPQRVVNAARTLTKMTISMTMIVRERDRMPVWDTDRKLEWGVGMGESGSGKIILMKAGVHSITEIPVWNIL